MEIEQTTVMDLIRKLHSPNDRITLRAVEELRACGWLADGRLKGANLRYVHLEWADLSGANLRGADLFMASFQGADLSLASFQGADLGHAGLQGADLSRANLKGADLNHANLHTARNLTDEQLAQASYLRGAMMPGGTRYDGRYNLPDEQKRATSAGFDLTRAEDRASYYGVPVEEAQVGLDWARANLKKLNRQPA